MISQIKVVGRVLWFAVQAGLKVQVGRSGATSLSDEGYHLPGLHMLTYLYHVLGVMGVICLQAIGVLDAYQISVAGEYAREHHFAVEGGIDLVLGLRLEVDTRMPSPTTRAVRADNLGTRQREAPLVGDGCFCA